MKINLLRTIFTAIILLFIAVGHVQAQKTSGKKKNKWKDEMIISPTVKADSTKNNYEKLIKGAIKHSGMFNVYEKGDKIYFEIPTDLMSRDFLLSSRVSSTSNNKDISAGQMTRNPFLVTFSADKNNVYIHNKSSHTLCDTTSSMYLSFKLNYLNPIWQSYKIEAITKDSSAYVIDITSLFMSDVRELSPFRDGNVGDVISRKKPMSGTLNGSRSALLQTKCFPQNINIKSRLSYAVDGAAFTCTVTRNLILLSETPMPIRLCDDRIGYFSDARRIFTEKKDEVHSYSIINRWDLRPRPEDVERHKNGESVEPAKPIVFYVDPAIPAKWRGYIRQGIEDWRIAFEAIGFKNAISAVDYPIDDPNFDPDDIRFSCYRLVTTDIENSMGPSWIDPRSGEIIQGDVLFYSNIVKLLHYWRFVQTAAVDPSVRKPVFDDELMGASLRYVAAHEIGHTLGLMHNFGASYSIPVDSLRSATFTQKYGTTSSIMDYTRYNYIAQPGDKGVRLSPPDLGIYDIFAIQWGYKPIYDASTSEQEVATLNRWIKEKSDNPMYKYTPQPFYTSFDPSAQAEDLGNDPIKAGVYGINNLKYIIKNLNEWTKEDDNKYQRLEESYKHILSQFYRYIGHSFMQIGGVYVDDVRREDGKKSITFVDKKVQKANLNFVLTEAMGASKWMNDRNIIDYIGPQESPQVVQYMVLRRLLSRLPVASLTLFEELHPSQAYTYAEYMDDIYKFVWKSSLSGQTPDFYQRAHQTSYVTIMLIEAGLEQPPRSPFGFTDSSIVGDARRDFMKDVDFETSAIEDRSIFNLNVLAEVDMVRNPTMHRKVMDTYRLLERLKGSGNSTLQAHYQSLYFRIKKALEK